MKKPVGLEVAEETPNLTGVCWRHPQGPRMYTNPLTQESAPEGPICVWVEEEVTKCWLRAEQVALFPLRPLPHIQTSKVGCPTLVNT